MLRGALAVALAATSGATATAERDLADALAGRVAGAVGDCIDGQIVDGPQIVDARTILYRGAGAVYRNDLAEPCPALRRDVLLIVETQGTRLCRDDRFRVLERGSTIASATCRLGSFTAYRKLRRNGGAK